MQDGFVNRAERIVWRHLDVDVSRRIQRITRRSAPPPPRAPVGAHFRPPHKKGKEEEGHSTSMNGGGCCARRSKARVRPPPALGLAIRVSSADPKRTNGPRRRGPENHLQNICQWRSAAAQTDWWIFLVRETKRKRTNKISTNRSHSEIICQWRKISPRPTEVLD